ncbi:hypothetical protein [Turneriella parva]|uniref:Uncharacterized protein n=1 Tax=Turneriella parva (strain ATCC BAA-1111 / DSM 21527 / NCTC 11395 / H) TaxID=869212 RepID=I4B764_TURPD|nr:hypothetical protein [Turneriella parva]AFM13121.1 hypothetical protein Turpa_2479 [Turneriella parva DSM 21527]
MMTTSVSLPHQVAAKWRRKQRKIMRMALRNMRVQMRKHKVRRGVTRRYNRVPGERVIVTTRFTEAEYDALHFVAASLRISVSLLIYHLILMWKKASRRHRHNTHVTNYETHVTIWHPNAGIVTESLMVWPKTNNADFTLRAEPEKILN